MSLRAFPIVVVACLCAALPAVALAQIVTENAGAISPFTPLLRGSINAVESDNAFDLNWNHQFIFSIDPTREFKLAVATHWRNVTFRDADNQRRSANLFGFGDTTLRFKQVFWKSDGVMESTRLAGVFEVIAPTGRHDVVRGGVDLPRGLQLGTGAWAGGTGPVFTMIRDRHRFSAEGMYRHRSRADGYQFGPTIDLNLAYWYRIAPARFKPDVESVEIRGVFEILGRYRFRSESGDRRVGDDGFLVWIAPGVQIFPPQKVLLVEANIQLPVYQTVDDSVGTRSWGASLVLKVLF